MAKFKNEEGEEFEAFSQEELDAKAKELSDAAAAKAIEDYKNANPAKTVEQIAAEKKIADEKAVADSEPLAKLAKELSDVKEKLSRAEVANLAKTYAGSDVEKQKSFTDMYSRLGGFEDSAEGVIARATAAAGAVGIDVKSVDISGVSGTGGGRNVDVRNSPKATEADTVVQKALGITSEDVKKYGPSVDEAIK